MTIAGPLAAARQGPLALAILVTLPAACGGHQAIQRGADGGGGADVSISAADVGAGGGGDAHATGGDARRTDTGGATASGGAGQAGVGGIGGGAGGAGGAQLSTGNLLRNGDAEEAPGSTDGKPVATPGWTSTGHATAIQYDSGLEYPSVNDPVPPDHGKNLFSGGPDDAVSTLSQTVDVSAYAVSIDAGTVQATLSGCFGGYSVQDDNATLTATFLTTSGQAVGPPLVVGPVLAADRNNQTGLWPRAQQTAVPVQTRSVQVVLKLTRVTGTIDDGYADDLSLSLSGR